MQKLIEAKLYRNELISISGKLVDRYNKCLKKLGELPTKLTSFSIDGLGWSPEIAEEKGDVFYLNNGEANPHAIIITPKQKGIPVYNPFHSYDKELMKFIFKNYNKEIQNITRDSALYVEFDQGIDVFYEPLDVLNYKNISLRFHLADDLKQAKQEQMDLIALFEKDYNFIDESIHQKLIESAKKYGDLRERKIDLPPLSFPVESFYTKAFGGVYVLRSFITDILVFESQDTFAQAIEDTDTEVLMYHIEHKELLDKLLDQLLIECNIELEVATNRYERIKKFVFVNSVTNVNHPIREILTNDTLFKGYLNKMSLQDRKRVMSVERYLDTKKKKKDLDPKAMVDAEMLVALHKPHSSLRADHQDLLWKLLITIAPKDVLFWYWYNTETFYESFESWDESMQDWVIETILAGF